MKLYIIFYIILTLLFAPFISHAQIQNEELEGNIEYRNNKSDLKLLLGEQSLLVVEIAKIKNQVNNNEIDKEKGIEDILELENKLFDLRNRIGVISAKCNAIEQEYIIRNLTKRKSVDNIKHSDRHSTNVNIFLNKFIIDNVSAEEMEIMMRDNNIDYLVSIMLDSIKINYKVIESINRRLRLTQEENIADSLFNEANTSFEAVEEYEAKLREEYGGILDTKIYVYTRLLDKLNVSAEVLSQLNTNSREVKSAFEDAINTKFSQIFYSYPIERTLILRYEKILAEKLVYLSAIDSLKIKTEYVKMLTCNEPIIELPDWDYVDFSPAKIGGATVHTSINSVKEVVIPTFGTVYMIRLGIYNNKLKNAATLKRVNKVSYFRNQEGKYEYYAGLFATKNEADVNLAKIKSLGFKASVVAWKSGGKVINGSVIVPIDVFKYAYRVEFGAINDELAEKLKKIAPTKEISRLDDKYSFGLFMNYLDAVKVEKAIGEQAKIVAVDVK